MLSSLSIVVPVFNEEESLADLIYEIHNVLASLDLAAYEIIIVDDGSTDSTSSVVNDLMQNVSNLRQVQLSRNYGQSAAMAAGFDESKYEIVIPLDGDGQNDPRDIPNLLHEFARGYQCVSGWRSNRKDKAISRRLPSRIANYIIGKATGVHLHDYGCTLKAYDREILSSFPIYGEMHRFLPVYMSLAGARVSEIEVNHRPRLRGKSKYGIGRTYRVLLDILVARAQGKFLMRPMHLFGGAGLITGALSIALIVFSIGLKILGSKNFVETPLLTIGAILLSISVSFILIGLLAEFSLNTSMRSGDLKAYNTKK